MFNGLAFDWPAPPPFNLPPAIILPPVQNPSGGVTIPVPPGAPPVPRASGGPSVVDIINAIGGSVIGGISAITGKHAPRQPVYVAPVYTQDDDDDDGDGDGSIDALFSDATKFVKKNFLLVGGITAAVLLYRSGRK